MLAGITSPLTVAIMLLCGIGRGCISPLAALRRFSFLMAAAVLLSPRWRR